MFPQDSRRVTPSQPAMLEATFERGVLERLQTLRQRHLSTPVWEELGLDPRRLAFARWLVQSGRLREDR